MHPRHKHYGHYTESAKKERGLAPKIHRVAALHQSSREPSADDGAYTRCGVNDYKRKSDLTKIKVVAVMEELGQIEKIEVEDRVGQPFDRKNSIESAVSQER